MKTIRVAVATAIMYACFIPLYFVMWLAPELIDDTEMDLVPHIKD